MMFQLLSLPAVRYILRLIEKPYIPKRSQAKANFLHLPPLIVQLQLAGASDPTTRAYGLSTNIHSIQSKIYVYYICIMLSIHIEKWYVFNRERTNWSWKMTRRRCQRKIVYDQLRICRSHPGPWWHETEPNAKCENIVAIVTLVATLNYITLANIQQGWIRYYFRF